MHPRRLQTSAALAACLVLLLSGWAPGAPASQPSTRPAAWRPTPVTRPAAPLLNNPRNVQDLHQIQTRVEDVVRRCTPAVVGVLLGSSQGSGVIISPDGYVLTAAHVAKEANREVTLVLADGRRVKATTLGMNRTLDSGLIKITTPGKYTHVSVGNSADLRVGQWCIALGHPGGYRRDRPPPVRLGRILTHHGRAIGTDCTLIGGDSGGPLFDLDGNVVGIHSRIGSSAQANVHVPIDTFIETWDRLLKSEVWGTTTAPSRRR